MELILAKKQQIVSYSAICIGLRQTCQPLKPVLLRPISDNSQNNAGKNAWPKTIDLVKIIIIIKSMLKT